MSPQYLAEMDSLFRKERGIDEMMSGEIDAEALSSEARAALSDMLAPFMAIRQRVCIGESRDRSQATGDASYPPFKIHPRPASLALSSRQQGVMDDITHLVGELAPGRRLTSVTMSRFGARTERQHNQNSLYARNLLNILRTNSAQALWEMRSGAIGRTLRRLEEERSRKSTLAAPPGQGDLFPDLVSDPDAPPRAPICDQLVSLLARKDIQRLDERRYDASLRIQARHKRVVFLAERIDTLEIFAESLARRRDADNQHIHYVAHSDTAKADGTDIRRAREDILGMDSKGFSPIRQGHRIEEYFRPGGSKSGDSAASVFLTYQMAEGINLQSADALVLLGVTSNLKDLLQGMGRIDRIDSPHSLNHYYLIDIPVAPIASDEKVTRRLENYRALSGQERLEHADDAEGDTQLIVDSVGGYLREPRLLRSRNYHDLLSQTRSLVDPERYGFIAGATIDGLWGAEIAVTEGAQAFTLLHLRGESGRGAHFAPPRLLLVEEDGTLVRNQIACAQRLNASFEETIAEGMATAPPDGAAMRSALEELGTRVGQIREWQLAPERTDSLLQSLSVFLSREDDGTLALAPNTEPEEALFGHLTLRGVEYLAETWARLLDPYWVRAKQQVRENFNQNAAQSYISIADMTDQLHADTDNRGRIRDIMISALDEAGRLEEKRDDAVSRRVSVALVSLRAHLH